MEFYPFPARLLCGYNSIQEYGSGRVAAHDNAIDFFGDFVPLIPLGTAACVDWIFGESTVASFSGRIYLSSPAMARLVQVDPGLAGAARETFKQNIRIPGRAAPEGSGENAFETTILYLSSSTLTLQTAHSAKEGGLLNLFAEVDFLTLDSLRLKVRQRLALRRADSLLICDVLPSGNENVIALSAYAARLEHL